MYLTVCFLLFPFKLVESYLCSPFLGHSEQLTERETAFWKDLIKENLKPLDIDDNEKERTKQELLELRNSLFAGLLVINAIFITIVFVLTQINTYKNIMSIEINCPVIDTSRADTLLIEPIPIAFTLVFGIILLVQFVGMLYHRFSTFSHIMATTNLRLFGKTCSKACGNCNNTVEESIVPTAEVNHVQDQCITQEEGTVNNTKEDNSIVGNRVDLRTSIRSTDSTKINLSASMRSNKLENYLTTGKTVEQPETIKEENITRTDDTDYDDDDDENEVQQNLDVPRSNDARTRQKCSIKGLSEYLEKYI